MALYDTRFGLPQSVVNYLNQGLPDIYQNIYTPPPVVDPDVEPNQPIVDPLYPQTGGNEDGFSVYNPDPNSTRNQSNYSPYAYRQASERSYIGAPGDYSYSSATEAQKMMDNYPDYYEGKQLTGIPAAIANYGKNSLLGRGLSALGDMLPVNRRAILENELLGGGFMLNNTGKIVSNDYNTPQGIMAGYNPVSGGLLNMLTGGKKGEPATYGLDKSYDKRRNTISETLKEKYGMTDEEIEAAIAGEYKGNVPINQATGMPTELINRLGLFNKSQNLLNKRLNIADTISNRKIEERQNQDRIITETKQKAEAARKNQTYTGGSDRQNVVDRNTGRRDATGGGPGSKGAQDSFSNKSGRGRTGY